MACRPLDEMEAGGCMPYDGVSVCTNLGVSIRRVWLRETWGAWIPRERTIVIAEGLSEINERCTLAHHIEHALAGHGPCGTGPYADRRHAAGLRPPDVVRRDEAADKAAARKLLSGVDLSSQRRECDLLAAAGRLGVTERLLALRLTEVFGEGTWPGTSKIAG